MSLLMKQKHIKNGEIKNYRVWANLMRTCLTQGLKMPCVAEFTHSYGHRHVTKTKRKFTPIEWALLAKEYHIWLRFMMHPGRSGNRVSEATHLLGQRILTFSRQESFAVVMILLEIKKPEAYAQMLGSM